MGVNPRFLLPYFPFAQCYLSPMDTSDYYRDVSRVHKDQTAPHYVLFDMTAGVIEALKRLNEFKVMLTNTTNAPR